VVDGGFNNSITDGLCNDLLSLFHGLEGQLDLDVLDRYLRVTNVDFLETKLDYSMLQAKDKGQDSVGLEHTLILLDDLLELFHITLLDSAHDLEVGVQRLLEVRLRENLSVWDLTHEQLNDKVELLYLETEAKGAELGALALRLGQVVEGLRVLELDSLDSAYIVEVAGVLVVRHSLGEVGLLDKVGSLLVEALGEVAPDDDVHDSSLADLVLFEAELLVDVEHAASRLGQVAQLLISH
jgi:hypothetical protein